jgi:hypothetical protein
MIERFGGRIADAVRRTVGVIASPHATYAEVVERPRSAAVLALVSAAMVAASAAFLSTDVGRQALLDSQIQTLEMFGRRMTAVEYRRFEAVGRHAALYGAVGQVAGLLASVAGVTLAGLAVGRLVLRAGAPFRQVWAVVSHSSVILGLRAICSAPLYYARESMSSPTNLALVLPIFEDGTFGARALAGIDLFTVWWLVSLSIGFGVAFHQRTTRVTLGLLAVYVAVALALAGTSAALSGV